MEALPGAVVQPEEERPPQVQPDRSAARDEAISLSITSLAAVATAWSAFQASTWGGTQTFALASSARWRQLSTESRLEGDQQKHLDADLFVAYAGALVEHRDVFATFLRERFPPRLQVATTAWLETKPLESHTAPPHPFAMPEYHVEAIDRAAAQQASADAAAAQAATANHNGDLYVLATVLLATVITVSALGSKLATRRGRRMALVLCGVVLLALIVWLGIRPVAWVSPG